MRKFTIGMILILWLAGLGQSTTKRAGIQISLWGLDVDSDASEAVLVGPYFDLEGKRLAFPNYVMLGPMSSGLGLEIGNGIKVLVDKAGFRIAPGISSNALFRFSDYIEFGYGVSPLLELTHLGSKLGMEFRFPLPVYNYPFSRYQLVFKWQILSKATEP